MQRKHGESFFDEVWEVVKLIPKGRVTSFGAIAKYLGTGRSARMVGWALSLSPEGVPAHRVVNREGRLTGKAHFDPPEKMEQLLKKEKVTVTNEKIDNFNAVFWDPAIALL